MNKLIPLYNQLILVLIKLRDKLIVSNQTVSMDTNFAPKIRLWARYIGIEEGSKPSLNNPGNLKLSTLTKSWGATPGFQATDGGWIAKFPTYQMGFNALCNFLTLGCENELLDFHSPESRTFEGFTKIYAGNPPQTYIDAIAKGLECSLEEQISSFLN